MFKTSTEHIRFVYWTSTANITCSSSTEGAENWYKLCLMPTNSLSYVFPLGVSTASLLTVKQICDNKICCLWRKSPILTLMVITAQPMPKVWWTKLQHDRHCSKYFSFLLLIIVLLVFHMHLSLPLTVSKIWAVDLFIINEVHNQAGSK